MVASYRPYLYQPLNQRLQSPNFLSKTVTSGRYLRPYLSDTRWPTAGKIPARLASSFAFSQPAISPQRGIITFLSHDLCMMGSGAKV